MGGKIETLDSKSTITEMTNSLEELNNRSELATRNSELEDRLRLSSLRKRKRMKNHEHSLGSVRHHQAYQHKHNGSPRRKEEEKKAERLLEEMTEHILNSMKNINHPKSSTKPKEDYLKEIHIRYIIIKTMHERQSQKESLKSNKRK